MEETRQLLENSFEAYCAPETLPLLVREIKTARTAADLRKLRVHAEVASFSTEFALSLPGRIHNIRLAASALDEFVLEPGDEFSFNAVVGEAGAAQGYLPAPVIEAGEIVEGFWRRSMSGILNFVQCHVAGRIAACGANRPQFGYRIPATRQGCGSCIWLAGLKIF